MQKTQITILTGFAVIFILLGAGCNPFAKNTESISSESVVEEKQNDPVDYGDPQMAEDTAFSNPATVYCLSQEGQFYMKKTMNGMTEGYCVLPGGLECEVWAMYKGECGKVKKPESDSSVSTTTEPGDANPATSTTAEVSKPSTTSTAPIQNNDETESVTSDNGKKKIEGEIDIAVRPGDEGEVIMTWDTHDFSAPEGYIVMLGTSSKLSHPAKFSHVLANENSYSFTWTDLNPDREYYFRVCIKKGENCSTYSPVISIVTQ